MVYRRPHEGQVVRGIAATGRYGESKVGGWRVIATAPHAEVVRPANEALQELLLVAGGVLLLSVLLATYLTRSISRPVQHLGAAARELDRGNLTTRVVAESDDELGVLARGFNRMGMRWWSNRS